jgi:mycothiol synthase
VRILNCDRLSADDVAAVLDLIAVAGARDGRAPVSEETLLELRAGSASLRHVLAMDDDGLVGYGALTTAAGPRAMLAEIAVRPDVRRHGYGEAILAALIELAAPARLSIWAHGAESATAGFAEAHGLRPDRRLWQMRVRLGTAAAPQQLPGRYRLRTFRPGADDAAFLAANAAAFPQLPDQGGWTQADLHARTVQDWFDPAGFFLVEAPGGEIAAFHWTKLHPPAPLGEVYVLGVVPAHRRRGLALALARHGLAHLVQCGADTAMLYVDAGNQPAVRLYARLGFQQVDIDTLYRM